MIGTRVAVGSPWPWSTFLINISGALLMGVLVEAFALRNGASPQLRLLLATGVLGGYTTFSTYALEIGVLLQRASTACSVVRRRFGGTGPGRPVRWHETGPAGAGLRLSRAARACPRHSRGDCPVCALNARDSAASLPYPTSSAIRLSGLPWRSACCARPTASPAGIDRAWCPSPHGNWQQTRCVTCRRPRPGLPGSRTVRALMHRHQRQPQPRMTQPGKQATTHLAPFHQLPQHLDHHHLEQRLTIAARPQRCSKASSNSSSSAALPPYRSASGRQMKSAMRR